MDLEQKDSKKRIADMKGQQKLPKLEKLASEVLYSSKSRDFILAKWTEEKKYQRELTLLVLEDEEL